MIRTPIESRRYLAQLDTQALGHLFTDVLVIGAGVGGLRAALELAPEHKAIVLAKHDLSDSNTYHAQGGIAAVLDPADTFEEHVRDTLTTGSGLSDLDVVEFIIRHAPAQIHQLEKWSLPFDRENSHIALGREGGHSAPRIAHALGHATGKAIASTLLQQARQQKNLKIFDHCFAIDLLTDESGCYGAFTHHPKFGYQCIWARCTILATGGAGQLWRETTNPAGATADGIGLAYRAGATVRDMEFMQFHPTTLYVAGAGRTLITEALRGAGAKLVDRQGRQFMGEYHPMGDLAPRDVVSRAIYQQISLTGATNVYLDLRHLGSAWLTREFPEIARLCQSFDLDPDADLIPVRPSAHYLVGGVRTDVHGRTDVDRLYCVGESASSGLHGANRLASNSLLEGLVLGQEAGRHAGARIARDSGPIQSLTIEYTIEPSQRTPLDIPDVTNSLRAVMWRNCGIERNAERLTETLEIIDFWRRYVMDKVFESPAGWELQNMLTVARIIADAALARRESRGTHFRTDFPDREDQQFQRHIEIAAGH